MSFGVLGSAWIKYISEQTQTRRAHNNLYGRLECEWCGATSFRASRLPFLSCSLHDGASGYTELANSDVGASPAMTCRIYISLVETTRRTKTMQKKRVLDMRFGLAKNVRSGCVLGASPRARSGRNLSEMRQFPIQRSIWYVRIIAHPIQYSGRMRVLLLSHICMYNTIHSFSRCLCKRICCTYTYSIILHV